MDRRHTYQASRDGAEIDQVACEEGLVTVTLDTDPAAHREPISLTIDRS